MNFFITYFTISRHDLLVFLYVYPCVTPNGGTTQRDSYKTIVDSIATQKVGAVNKNMIKNKHKNIGMVISNDKG